MADCPYRRQADLTIRATASSEVLHPGSRAEGQGVSTAQGDRPDLDRPLPRLPSLHDEPQAM